ncbi:MAG: extracellular solute-binding protein, partial [Clostridia bacterium]
MRVKKFLAIGISCVLVMSVFSGCKTKSGEKAKELKSTLDFNGETIKIAYPPGYDMLDTNGSNPVLVKRDAKYKELAEKYNCVLKQKEGKGNYWDVMANSIASGSPEGHIMVTNGSHVVDWIKSGAVSDLTDAMAETGIDFTDEKYAQVTRRYTNFNNKQYGFFEATPYPSGSVVVFNKRIFNELQLEDPYKLVKEKKWTWDKVEELAKAATKRNPDGNVTQWGIGGVLHFDFLMMLANSNGGGISDYNKETGEPELTLTKPNSQKAFELMNKWISVDKIARVNNGAQPWEAIMVEFVEGNIAMLQGPLKITQIAAERNMKDDYGVVYYPMGPDVKDYQKSVVLAETYFIPITYKDKASKLLLFMDEAFTYSKEDSLEKRIAERNMPRLRDTESLEIITDMAVNTKDAIGEIYFMTGIDWTTPSIADI